MGPVTSRSESNQTNSFIHVCSNFGSLNFDDSRSSSLASSLVEEVLPQNPNQITITFKWIEGGSDVYLSGSFNNWSEKLEMEQFGNDFVLFKQLDRGIVYEYKFIVDGIWKCAHDQPIKKDQNGNFNNWIDTGTLQDINLQENKPSNEYTQEYCSDFTTMDPDILPEHLHYVLANHSNSFDYKQKETIPHNSPIRQSNNELGGENCLSKNELPIPAHVILNHAGVRANERVIGLTTTQRYRQKFITTMYYKPINKLFN